MIARVPSRRTTAGRSRPEAQPCARRRGSILVEFALVALAFYLLLAGTLELGRMITTAQVLQNAARTAARELALMELPATMTFDEALACPRVRDRVFDASLLAVNIGGGMPNTDAWPVVNRLLLPVMIVNRVNGTDYLQFPGALVQSGGEVTVAVPHVVSRGANGAETIRWVPVLEEVRPDSADPTAAPFSLASTGPERGLVALRINCPYQATTLTAYQPVDPTAPNPTNEAILANDGAVTQLNQAPGALIGGGSGAGAYSGTYGLGKFYSLKKEVRPFRRLISAQSAFRREVFSPGQGCPP